MDNYTGNDNGIEQDDVEGMAIGDPAWLRCDVEGREGINYE